MAQEQGICEIKLKELVMLKTVLIPEERKAVLIGKDGKTKHEIEELGHVKLVISDAVEISGEGLDVLKAVSVVKAIGRGFPPKKAFMLFDDEYTFEIISLTGKNENTIKRIMSRIIGRNGSSRRIIEERTGCHISVYGKTIAIIGRYELIERAVSAVEQLISGHSHAFVYKRLKRRPL